MNRRELLTGAAALVVSPVLPVCPVAPEPIVAIWAMGIDRGFGPSWSAWVLCEVIRAGEVRVVEVLHPGDPRIGEQLLHDIEISGTVTV